MPLAAPIARLVGPLYNLPVITSRLDDDSRLKVPGEVLAALGLKPGDQIGFHIEDGQVVLYRAAPDDELDEVTGLTVGEIRTLLAEADDGPTVSLDEAFANVRVHIKEVARKSNAA